jgi:hypothetical protein
MRRRIAALTLLVTALLAGCAPQDPPDVEALSGLDAVPRDLVAWRNRVTAVCHRFEPQVEAAMANAGDPQNIPGFALALDDLVPLNRRYTNAIVRVPPPHHRRAKVERLYELAQQTQAAGENLRAVAAGPFVDVLAFNAAYDDLQSLSERSSDLMAELGLRDCVTED